MAIMWDHAQQKDWNQARIVRRKRPSLLRRLNWPILCAPVLAVGFWLLVIWSVLRLAGVL